MKKLSEISLDTTIEIFSIESSLSCGQRLRDMGLVEGTLIKVLQRIPWSHFLLIECRGGLLALETDLAAKIWVKGDYGLSASFA